MKYLRLGLLLAFTCCTYIPRGDTLVAEVQPRQYSKILAMLFMTTEAFCEVEDVEDCLALRTRLFDVNWEIWENEEDRRCPPEVNPDGGFCGGWSTVIPKADLRGIDRVVVVYTKEPCLPMSSFVHETLHVLSYLHWGDNDPTHERDELFGDHQDSVVNAVNLFTFDVMCNEDDGGPDRGEAL